MNSYKETSVDHGDEKRNSERIQLEVPVRIGQEKAVTRDVGWGGIYFLAIKSYLEGEALNFALDLSYALPGQPIKLHCHGEVIRVEQNGKRYGVAAKIHNFQYVQ
jgi:hypothetical protein